MNFRLSGAVLGLGLLAATSAAHAQSLNCSGNWMMTTDQGHVFVGAAKQDGYTFEWTGASSHDQSITLRGSLDPSTGNVNLFRADRPDILFQAEIDPNCGQIRGAYRASRESTANHFVMTRTQAASGALPLGAEVQQTQTQQQASIGENKTSGGNSSGGSKGILRSLFGSDGDRGVNIAKDRLRKY